MGRNVVNMLLLSRHSWRNFGELVLTIILVKKIIIAIFDFYFYNSRRLGGGGEGGKGVSDGQKVRRGWGWSDRNLLVFLHREPMMLTRPQFNLRVL